jgi:hypothetical protein
MNNEQTEKEYRKAILFTMASKKSENKLKKGNERSLQPKLYTTEKETEEDLRSWKDLQWSTLEEPIL